MKIGAHYLGGDRCEFTVWALNSQSVTLKLLSPRTEQIPLHAQADGYWSITLDNIPVGTRYLYQLDTGELHPDPASFSQPEGVHKPSEVVDLAFDWSDRDWAGVPLEQMILYELHVGTFTPEGTFEAIIPRLKELRELGITAIELMPIAQFPGDEPTGDRIAYRNWGYDGVYLYAVQNSYGGVAGLKQLVNACHQEGISVVLDVVYNHFGPEGNYMSHFAPYFTQTYQTPWGSAINFDDAHSPEVRNFFLQNALYWLRDFHIDSLRLDAIHAIYDLGAKHFLEELATTVHDLSKQDDRKRYLIAESDLNNARIIRPVELGGYGLDAQWSDDFHHALHSLLTGTQIGYYQDFGNCEDLAKAYRDTFVYDWKYAPHRSRFHGAPCVDRSPIQFAVCIQNHDQIGNQLLGERLSQLISFEGLKLAAGAVILSPYIPLLFMGEEYGEDVPFTYFVSHSDPELIKAVRQGRKSEFAAFHYEGEPPDPEGIETFTGCKLNWEKRKTEKHQVLWSWYQRLIQLRSLPALKTSDRTCIDASFDETNKLVWWRRWSEDQQIYCLMSFNHTEVAVHPTLSQGNWRKVLDSTDEKWAGPGASLPETLTVETAVVLKPQSIVLYEAT